MVAGVAGGQEKASQSDIGEHLLLGGAPGWLWRASGQAVEVLHAHLLRCLSGGCLSSQATANPLIPWDMKAAICTGHSYR